jgi:hypothetical protein
MLLLLLRHADKHDTNGLFRDGQRRLGTRWSSEQGAQEAAGACKSA